MSTGETADPFGSEGPGSMSEEELRAAYEAEIKKLRVEQVVLEQVVSVINLGMRRTGLSPGTEDERDLGQVRLAIESIRALMPIIDQIAGPQAGQIREALAQLQMAFVRLGGSAPAEAGSEPPATPPPAQPTPPQGAPAQSAPDAGTAGDAGPAQRSGRLWIPGQ